MIDGEKIITHLDDMRLFADTRVHQVVSPENWGVYSDLCDFIDLVKEEILVLLKEKEAVPVVQREVMHMLVWCCGSCGVAITDGDKFCRMCGKKVKWNEGNRNCHTGNH